MRDAGGFCFHGKIETTKNAQPASWNPLWFWFVLLALVACRRHCASFCSPGICRCCFRSKVNESARFNKNRRQLIASIFSVRSRSRENSSRCSSLDPVFGLACIAHISHTSNCAWLFTWRCQNAGEIKRAELYF